MLDLNSINCYENPKYLSTSKEIVQANNKLNEYLCSKIIYTFGDKTKVLNEAEISNMLQVDGNFN